MSSSQNNEKDASLSRAPTAVVASSVPAPLSPSNRIGGGSSESSSSVSSPRASAAAAAAAAAAASASPSPLVPRLKVPIIVGVAGASGSGKTSIATLISEALHNELKIIAISMDNYYKGLPKNTDASVYNWDHPEALDMELLASHLRALHRGEDVHVPHYDFSAHARRPSSDSTVISARDTDVVIIDGIFVLAVPAVRDACDLTLFTVEDLDVCLARRLRRDIAERGRSVDSVLEQYTRFVKPGFHNFIQPSMNFADILVPRARENIIAIEMVASEVSRRVDHEIARAATGVPPTPRPAMSERC